MVSPNADGAAGRAVLLIGIGLASWIAWGCRTPRSTAGERGQKMTGRQTPRAFPERLVLGGVPKIGYKVRHEDAAVRHTCPFPGSLEAVLKFLGEPCDYDYIMTVAGAPFRRFWNKDDGGNVSLEYLAPECYRRAFWALGYRYTSIERLDRDKEKDAGKLKANRAEILAAIQASLAGGRPVLGPIAGPECGVITGYEKDGDVLVGWSYFRDDKGECVREEDWYNKLCGAPFFVFIGDKTTRPTERDVLTSTLRWGIKLARTAKGEDLNFAEAGVRYAVTDHLSGLAACDAWAAALEVDADYPKDTREVMGTRRMIHTDQACMTHERGSATSFLNRMAEAAPEAAPELRRAAVLFDEAHPSGDLHKKLADPAARRALAARVRVLRGKEAAGIEQLEKALGLIDAGVAGYGVEPRIVQMKAMQVLGVLRRVDLGKPDPGVRAVWDRDFAAVQKQIRPHSTDGRHYGVSLATTAEGAMDYLAGMAVKGVAAAPEGLVLRTVPAGRYAVFEFTFEQQVKGGPEYAYRVWLPKSRYERSPAAGIGDYTRFGKGPVQFCIPVREKDRAQGRPAPDAMELKLPGAKRRTWIEGFATPGGLRPLVQFMGAEAGFAPEGDWYTTESFPLFMGVCGDAFRFVWYRQDNAKRDRRDAFAVASPAARYLAALDAAGFDARLVFDPALTGTPSSLPWDAVTLRREVVASIAQRKWPVLVADLPEPGWMAVITGYEKAGEVLIGWCEEGWESFGLRFDPAKKRRFADWFPKAGGVVLLTGKHPRPPEADVFRAALAGAVPELRRRAAGHLHAGPATFEVLARRLEDASLSTDDAETAKRRNDLLHPMIWDLATQRHYASEFLNRSAEVFPPAAEELKVASGLFKAIHDAVWEINRIGGGKQPGSPLPKAIDPAVRRQIARIVLQCRDRDLEAAKKTEEALAKIPPPERAELKPSPLVEEPPGTRPQIECMPGPGVLRALMEFIGEDFGFSTSQSHNVTWRTNECFPLFMAVYGDSFRFVWLPREGQPIPEGDLSVLDDQPRRFLACLDAAGFSAQAIAKPGLSAVPPPLAWDEPTLRRQIVASIVERRRPVVLMGLPKRGWAGIVTGYEKGGEVLTGWCAEGGDDRGIRFEPAKRQTFTDWFPKVTQIVLLTGQRVRMPEGIVYRKALERAAAELKATEFGAFHAGPATFDARAKQIGDPALSKDDAETARKRGRILDPMIWDLATRRHCASLFLKRAAELMPASADDLKAASDSFRAIHDAMWEINRLGGAKRPGQPLPKLIDPAVRKQIAQVILKSRDRDLEAAKSIEAALAKKGNPKAKAANTLKLDGLRRDKTWVSQVGCLKTCMDYLGIDVSTEWLAGGTGQAFFVNVHGDIDCAGPTGWNEEPVRELARNLGARVTTGVRVERKTAGAAYPAWQRAAYDFARANLGRGIPCYGYEIWLWIPDWQTICGCDDIGYYYLAGKGPGGPSPWQKLGEADIKAIQVFAVERCAPADDVKIVRDACDAALRHAAGVPRYRTAITGPAAFAHWAEKLASGQAERDCCSYNAAFYLQCRQMAVAFLREANRRLPGRCDQAFDEAIAQYTIVRDGLAALARLCPSRDNADWKSKFQSKEGAEAMRAAAEAERRGLAELKKIVATLAPKP